MPSISGVKPHVTIVAPCFNEEFTLPVFLRALQTTFDQLKLEYEPQALIVDDGSADGSWQVVCEFARRDPRITGISLSRNFGHQAALTCGYQYAQGDAVVSMDADLQDPPEVIAELLTAWEEGADIVFAVRKERRGETWFKRATAAGFYRLIHALGLKFIPQDCGDFRLLSRRALDVLKQMPERDRFLRGMVGWMGFTSARVHYTRNARVAGKTKFSFRRMLRFSADAIISFTNWPLRFAFVIASLGALTVSGYLAYVLIQWVTGKAELVPGWTSLLLVSSLFGFSNLICMGILGEYIGRTYNQIQMRPLFLVDKSTLGSIDLPKVTKTDTSISEGHESGHPNH